jgi:hypothetical protein
MQPAKEKPLTPIAPSVGFPLRSAPPDCLPIHAKTLSWQNGDAVLPASVRNAADFCKRLGAFGLLAGFAVVFLVCFGIAFQDGFSSPTECRHQPIRTANETVEKQFLENLPEQKPYYLLWHCFTQHLARARVDPTPDLVDYQQSNRWL